MTIFFDEWKIYGMGVDNVGLFVLIKGHFDGQNSIDFVKKYKSHEVKYTGKVISWKIPFKAGGR